MQFCRTKMNPNAPSYWYSYILRCVRRITIDKDNRQPPSPPVAAFQPFHYQKDIAKLKRNTLQAWNHNDAFHNRRDKQKKLLASPLQSPTDFSDTLFSKLAWISWLCHGTVMRFMGSNYITLTKISEIWNPLSSFFRNFIFRPRAKSGRTRKQRRCHLVFLQPQTRVAGPLPADLAFSLDSRHRLLHHSSR